MPTYTALHITDATLIATKAFKVAGQFNFTVPAGANYMRASALGCGGQGDHWGGGAAFARSVVPVTPTENIKVQVGDVSTASTPGDSWVKRNDGTTVICYADRGRGNGSRGLAANSIGDVTRDGLPGNDSTGVGGSAPGDSGDFGAVGLSGVGTNAARTNAAGPGGGGKLQAVYDENNNFVKYIAYPAGQGGVRLEFFDTNPNY